MHGACRGSRWLPSSFRNDSTLRIRNDRITGRSRWTTRSNNREHLHARETLNAFQPNLHTAKLNILIVLQSRRVRHFLKLQRTFRLGNLAGNAASQLSILIPRVVVAGRDKIGGLFLKLDMIRLNVAVGSTWLRHILIVNAERPPDYGHRKQRPTQLNDEFHVGLWLTRIVPNHSAFRKRNNLISSVVWLRRQRCCVSERLSWSEERFSSYIA